MKPHAFVAMPFGVKQDSQGNEIDFNRVYRGLIKPALEAAGLEVFRADEVHAWVERLAAGRKAPRPKPWRR